jgi:hypothetical protein
MKLNHSSWVVAIVAIGFPSLLGCGGASSSATSGPPDGAAPAEDEAGTVSTTVPIEAGAPVVEAGPPPVDHGALSTTYPAYPPSFGQITKNGGIVMTTPTIVSITWNSDASQASFDAFADTIGQTSYWSTTTGEYGVGPAVSGAANHVHNATTAPATMQDSDLQTLVATHAGATGGWPAPTANTVYAFFLPPGTSLDLGAAGGGGSGSGDACSQGVGGYHDQVSIGSIVTSYAVVPSCNFGDGNTAAQQSTLSMSHELIEAATDPEPESPRPGYVGFDSQYFAFDYFQQFQDEVADACELFASSFYEETETTPAPFDYWVQRTWSNKSGPAGHDPCVPAPATPYFNVAPLDLTSVTVSLPSDLTGAAVAEQETTQGYKVPAGTSATFALGFYSDAATPAPWLIKATAGNPLASFGTFNASSVAVSLDKTTGQNGEKAYLTVTVADTGSALEGELVTITSSLGNVQHYMPIWIAGQ